MISISTMLQADEGLKYKAYKDTNGKTTVGIGFNMDDSKARGVWIMADIPESFNVVYTGGAISKNSISKIFTICIHNCKTDLKTIFTDFDDYPNYVQLVLINLMFNMGKPVLSQFYTFINLIKDKDYIGAANDLNTTKWATQLPTRAKRVIALLKEDDTAYSAYYTDSTIICA